MYNMPIYIMSKLMYNTNISKTQSRLGRVEGAGRIYHN